MVDKPKFIRLFELLLKDELVSLPAGRRSRFSARLLPGANPQRREVQVEIQDDGPGLPRKPCASSSILSWCEATARRSMASASWPAISLSIIRRAD